MNRHRFLRGLTGLLAVTLLFAQASASDEPVFLRIAEAEDGRPEALQVAIAEYRAADGTRLDLVGAVHVADPEYFAALNRSFADYDAVLYELVGDPVATARTDAPERSLSAVGLLQGGMKDMLGLAFQLDEIDYDQGHFVHADMTGEEFEASMAERNESLLQMMFRAWLTGLASQTPEQAADAQVGLWKVLFAEDRQLALKRMFARELAGGQAMIEQMAGPDSTLIAQRNLKALDVLEKVRTTDARRIALFYGAGHFPDFHRRLLADHGFEPAGVRWVDAWRLD